MFNMTVSDLNQVHIAEELRRVEQERLAKEARQANKEVAHVRETEWKVSRRIIRRMVDDN